MSIVARRTRTAVTFLIALCIAWWGVKFLTSRTYEFGNPSNEERVGACRLAAPAAGTVRLYEGDGGAMTGKWYSATLRPAGTMIEHQFFYAYGAPLISALRCDTDGKIVLVGTDSVRRYTVADAESHFRFVIRYREGQQVDSMPGLTRVPAGPTEGARPIGWLMVVASLVCAGLALRWVVAIPRTPPDT